MDNKMTAMKKILHSTLLLGAALLGGLCFASCNSDNEPEDPYVETKLNYSMIQAPDLFQSPFDQRDKTQKEVQELVTAKNRGAVVLRTLKEVENYFGSKLEENSPLRDLDYSKNSVITATLPLLAPIVKTNLGWAKMTNSKTEFYLFSCLLQYENGTQDTNGNIYYIAQPAIVVDAIPTGAYVFPDFNATTTDNQ